MAYVAVSLAALVTALLTLFSGFGLGTLLLPVFAIFFPLEIAVAATAVVHLANNVFKHKKPCSLLVTEKTSVNAKKETEERR